MADDNSDLTGQIQNLNAQIDQAQQQLDALNAQLASLSAQSTPAGTGPLTGPGAGTPGAGGPGGTGPAGSYHPTGQNGELLHNLIDQIAQSGNLPANYQLGSAMLFSNGDLRRFGFGGQQPQNLYPVGNGASNYQAPPMPSFTPPGRNSAPDAQPLQPAPNRLTPAP